MTKADKIESILAKCVRNEKTNCFEWTGSRGKRANQGEYTYPSIQYMKKAYKGHRLLWMLTHDVVITPTDFVCHKCDNMNCLNIDHLYLGNAKTNAGDMSDRRRGNYSRRNACSRGHEYTPENTSIKRWNKEGRTFRACKACIALAWHRSGKKRRAELAAERSKFLSERGGVDEYDPTPYCHVCGAKRKAHCNCGEVADNE